MTKQGHAFIAGYHSCSDPVTGAALPCIDTSIYESTNTVFHDKLKSASLVNTGTDVIVDQSKALDLHNRFLCSLYFLGLRAIGADVRDMFIFNIYILLIRTN
jgi:hypothetical protein